MKHTTTVILAIFVLLTGGCGLLGGSKISNEQISSDLTTKTLDGKNSSTLDLSGKYSSHCFQVTESKFNGDSAEIKLFLSGTEVMTGGDEIKVVIGDVNLGYKKDGDKWKLDKVDSKDLDIKSMSMADTLTKFAPLSKPICAVFSSSTSKK
jgi:hypothetical protein